MEPAQREALLPILAAARDMTVATLRADGYPQATIVSYVNEGLAIYFGSGGNSPETADIAGDDRISAAIASPHARWSEIRAPSLAGRVHDSREMAPIAELLPKKFPRGRGVRAQHDGGNGPVPHRPADRVDSRLPQGFWPYRARPPLSGAAPAPRDGRRRRGAWR